MRGLAQTEQIPMCNIDGTQKEESTSSNNSDASTKTTNNHTARRSTPCYPLSPQSDVYQNHNSHHLNSPPPSGLSSYDSHIRLPQLPIMPNISFNNDSQSDRNCQSPLQRRKQVRTVLMRECTRQFSLGEGVSWCVN